MLGSVISIIECDKNITLLFITFYWIKKNSCGKLRYSRKTAILKLIITYYLFKFILWTRREFSKLFLNLPPSKMRELVKEKNGTKNRIVFIYSRARKLDNEGTSYTSYFGICICERTTNQTVHTIPRDRTKFYALISLV